MTAENVMAEQVLDLEMALENLDGDVELLQEVIEIFLEMVPEQLDNLEDAIATGRISDVQRQAHSLKGSASNFCATRFVQTAYTLEHAAKAGSLDRASDLLRELRAEHRALIGYAPTIDWNTLLEWQG